MSVTVIDASACAIRGVYYPHWQLVRVKINEREAVVVHKDYMVGASAAQIEKRVHEYVVAMRAAHDRSST